MIRPFSCRSLISAVENSNVCTCRLDLRMVKVHLCNDFWYSTPRCMAPFLSLKVMRSFVLIQVGGVGGISILFSDDSISVGICVGSGAFLSLFVLMCGVSVCMSSFSISVLWVIKDDVDLIKCEAVIFCGEEKRKMNIRGSSMWSSVLKCMSGNEIVVIPFLVWML